LRVGHWGNPCDYGMCPKLSCITHSSKHTRVKAVDNGPKKRGESLARADRRKIDSISKID
jgi:hypothetical protein